MKDSKLKQWIMVFSPVLVYMLLNSTLKFIFDFVFEKSSWDILASIERSVLVSSASTICMLPIVLVWYYFINKSIHFNKLQSVSNYLILGIEIIIMSLAISIATMFVMDLIYGDLRDVGKASTIELVAVCFVAPICEELIYRDVVFKRCNVYFGKGFAIIFSGLMFGVAHSGSAVQMLIAIVVGMIFNLIYLRYHSVIVTILVHMAVNLISYSPYIQMLPNSILILGFVSFVIMLIILLYHYNDDEGRIKFKGE